MRSRAYAPSIVENLYIDNTNRGELVLYDYLDIAKDNSWKPIKTIEMPKLDGYYHSKNFCLDENYLYDNAFNKGVNRTTIFKFDRITFELIDEINFSGIIDNIYTSNGLLVIKNGINKVQFIQPAQKFKSRGDFAKLSPAAKFHV